MHAARLGRVATAMIATAVARVGVTSPFSATASSSSSPSGLRMPSIEQGDEREEEEEEEEEEEDKQEEQ
ncbi:unnamed protein product [Prorocentrum cordatum]|uniref:Uncharacterized protein n=1 Tax=Prorocentrum cordatum TaxID=2364126 RepID=A0ABN9Y3R8_9DINO|nr:unnamed protein product [Polarella glacialis]